MGILYIAAYLRQKGVSVKVLDLYPQKISLTDLLETIEKEKPLIVGISSMTPAIRVAVQIAKAIKEKFGEKLYVGIGGVHNSCDTTLVERYPYFDFQIIGEGEFTFYEIVQSVIRGEKPQLTYYGKTIENLDELPFPARDLLEDVRYVCPHEKSQEKPIEWATLLTTRGCPFQCVFCSKPPHRNEVRNRSAKNIVDEIEEIVNKKGITYFSIVDDNIGFKQDWLIGLADEILSRRLKIRWCAQMRITNAKEEVIKKISAAGCIILFFGVESGSERIRNKIIRKGVKDKEIIEATRLCRKYGIESNFYLMMGFPTETKEDLKATGDIGIKANADVIGIHLTKILPGSRLYERAIEEGKTSKDFVDEYIRGEHGEDWAVAWPTYIPDGLTIKDLVEAKKSAYRRFYMRPRWFFQRYWKKPSLILQDLKRARVVCNVLVHGATDSTIDARLD
jgi:radical SAM superfamily enzyme YgiQ (UPF0313 family)